MYLNLETILRPETIEDCLAALKAPASAAIAGGTYINVHGHEDLRALIDLQALNLSGLRRVDERLEIGAATTLAALVADPETQATGLGALFEAARDERNLAIRNRSTLGGRLARPTATARLGTALLALNAELSMSSLSSEDSKVILSTIALKDWLHRLAAGEASGLITTVKINRDTAWSGYLSSSLTAIDAPTADAAVAVSADGEVKIASGGHGDDSAGVRTLPATSAWVGKLDRQMPPSGWKKKLHQRAIEELPEHTDALVGGAYRRDLAATLIVRLVDAWLQGGRS